MAHAQSYKSKISAEFRIRHGQVQKFGSRSDDICRVKWLRDVEIEPRGHGPLFVLGRGEASDSNYRRLTPVFWVGLVNCFD